MSLPVKLSVSSFEPSDRRLGCPGGNSRSGSTVRPRGWRGSTAGHRPR